jgi:hypothetical protein
MQPLAFKLSRYGHFDHFPLGIQSDTGKMLMAVFRHLHFLADGYNHIVGFLQMVNLLPQLRDRAAVLFPLAGSLLLADPHLSFIDPWKIRLHNILYLGEDFIGYMQAGIQPFLVQVANQRYFWLFQGTGDNFLL